MNKQLKHIVLHLCLLFITAFGFGCSDDFSEQQDGGLSEGKEVTISLQTADIPVVVSRSAADAFLENAALIVFDTSGRVVEAFTKNLDGKKEFNCYLPAGSALIRAVCNLENPEAFIAEIQTLEEYQQAALTIERTSQLYREGCYVMSGELAGITPTDLGNPKIYTIPLYRLAAKFDFTIRFDPAIAGEEFKISKVTAVHLPKKSFYQKTDDPSDITVSCTTDAVYEATQTGSDALFFSEVLELSKDETINDTYTTSLHMFENRRGGISEAEGNATYWKDLDEEHLNYRQLNKRQIADDKGLHSATYLLIEGVYNETEHLVSEAEYYVYLGADNFKDFNVRRNHHYRYTVTIQSLNSVDTRIESEMLTEMSIYPSLQEDEKLDAHFNVTEVLMYSPEPWEIEVVNPDDNPWLELSKSASYQPLLLGDTNEDGKKASFRLSGSAGLQYFYIHTDEYVPYVQYPVQNGELINYKDRSATIRYRSGNKEWKTYTVTQMAPLLLILQMYDARQVKWITDVYYMERKLEKKNLTWGFLQYWSLTMDDLISAGQWDGLSNTRKLYQMALYGDHESNIPPGGGWPEDLSGQEPPAYPEYTETGVLPESFALGYAIRKNRDRNGNGRIDYDEVLWYMPAIRELKQIYDEMHEYELAGYPWLLDDVSREKFHSSTPSYTGPTADNPGRVYYLKMKEGDTGLALRSREYNVLCCRRQGGWRGNEDAGGNGNVNVPSDGWNDEHDVLPDNKE